MHNKSDNLYNNILLNFRIIQNNNDISIKNIHTYIIFLNSLTFGIIYHIIENIRNLLFNVL